MIPRTDTVAFSRLLLSDEVNARQRTTDALDELAASILAKGVIAPLVVRPHDGEAGGGSRGPLYDVVDGRRRMLAIEKLVKARRLPTTFEVPVVIRDEDTAEAFETSLAANMVRLPPHPVDQHEAMARLARPVAEGGRGLSPADIAARFGIGERTVRQHLALGALAPEIRAAWRKGRLSAETAQAFALHPDPAVQVATLAALTKRAGPNGVHDWAVRNALADKREPVDECPELRLVGEEAYRAAGGTITDDLFSEARYVDDVPLVQKLARDRLLAECRRLVDDEGWAWAEIEGEPLPRYRCALVDGVDDEADPATVPKALRAKSGCLVRIDQWGDTAGALTVYCGLLRPEPHQADIEDAIGGEAGEEDDDGGDPGPLPSAGAMARDVAEAEEDEAAGPWDVSGALLEDITRAQTAAVATAIGLDSEMALRIAVAALTAKFSPVRLTAQGHATTKSLAERLKSLHRADPFTLGVAVQQAVAQSVELTTFAQVVRHDADALVAVLAGTDYLREMRERFSAADYFTRARRETAIAALEEMTAAGASTLLATADVPRMKKGDLAAAVARDAKACGWLPPQLRHPEYRLDVPVTDEPPARAKRGKKAAARDDEDETPEPVAIPVPVAGPQHGKRRASR